MFLDESLVAMSYHNLGLLLVKADDLTNFDKQLSYLPASDIFFSYIFKLTVNVGF